MFAKVYQITQLLDTRISYVKDAKENGLGDEKYFSEMENLIRSGLDSLKRNSTNKKLISKYTMLINELF